MNTLKHITGALAVAALTAGGLLGSQTVFAQQRAVIHFADLGGIKDWRPDGNMAMYIEGRNNKWYRATFYTPCIGLQYQDTMAFVTEPNGALNSFSSVLVDGQRCFFKTFDHSDAPSKVPARED